MAKGIPIKEYISDDRLTITGLSWERIFMNLTVTSDYDEEISFSFASITFMKSKIKYDSSYNGETTDIPAEILDEFSIIPDTVPGEGGSSHRGEYKFRLNMSIICDGQFMDNGKWYLVGRRKDDEIVSLCCMTNELAYRMDDLSKVYMYGPSRYAYMMYFASQCFDEVNVVPVFISKFLVENTRWNESFVLSNRKTLKGKFNLALRAFKIWLLQMLYNMVSRLHKYNGKNILLMSETKPYLWGNLKYINDRLVERGLDKEYNISRSFRIAVGQNNSAANWFRTMRLLARQDVIFVDDYAPVFGYLNLSPHTKLVQVWHAGEGFKSVGYCRFGLSNSPYPIGSCHRKYDYVVTASERHSRLYSEVFGQPMDHMLPLGMARLDGFLDEDVIKEKTDEFYAEHPEVKGKKLILFCPTFRGPVQKKAYFNYEKLDLGRIYEFCGDEYIWAFKMHPFVKKKPPIPEEYSDRIIDLTPSKNINDLYYVTDVMITDYSSAYFEYALLQKPVLFYTYDRENYEITRGVHKPILETAPGKVCDTFDELMDALKNEDYEIEKTIRFHDENFGDYDGKAADRIIDTIILGK